MNQRAFQVADFEMERRWNALLAAMEKEDVDCLLCVNNMDYFEGPARYISDIPLFGWPYSIIFGKEGITAVSSASMRGGEAFRPYMNLRNAAFSAGQPGIPTMMGSDDWMPEELLKSLKKFGHKRIGLVGKQFIPCSITDYLRENLPGAEFLDASRLVYTVMAVKSEYEMKELYLPAVKLHDDIMAMAKYFVRPGRSCHDVSLDIMDLCAKNCIMRYGVFVDCAPKFPGIGSQLYNHSTQIHWEDTVQILLELCTDRGIWCELARMFCFGEADADISKCCTDTFAIQDKIAAAAVPGARASDLFAVQSAELASKGYNPELWFDIHGSGYSMCEHPYGMADDNMELQENMFLQIHPACVNRSAAAFNCDSYIVKKDGARLLSSTPRKLFIL